MVIHAPEMTAVLVAVVLVHRSDAFHVNIVTMRNVGWNMDIVRLKGGGTRQESALPMGLWTYLIVARFVPNIRTTFKLIYQLGYHSMI